MYAYGVWQCKHEQLCVVGLAGAVALFYLLVVVEAVVGVIEDFCGVFLLEALEFAHERRRYVYVLRRGKAEAVEHNVGQLIGYLCPVWFAVAFPDIVFHEFGGFYGDVHGQVFGPMMLAPVPFLAKLRPELL